MKSSSRRRLWPADVGWETQTCTLNIFWDCNTELPAGSSERECVQLYWDGLITSSRSCSDPVQQQWHSDDCRGRAGSCWLSEGKTWKCLSDLFGGRSETSSFEGEGRFRCWWKGAAWILLGKTAWSAKPSVGGNRLSKRWCSFLFLFSSCFRNGRASTFWTIPTPFLSRCITGGEQATSCPAQLWKQSPRSPSDPPPVKAEILDTVLAVLHPLLPSPGLPWYPQGPLQY